MTFTNITPGSQNWDVPVNAAFTDQDARITANSSAINVIQNPQNKGSVVGWTYDPFMISGSTTPGTNGTLYMFKIEVPTGGLVSNIVVGNQAAGSGFVANQNFAGIYNSSGALLAQSADLATIWTMTNKVMIPMLTPVTLPAGTYYAGFVFNSTTRPSLLRNSSVTAAADIINLNLAPEMYNFSTSGAGLTALPSSVTMAGRNSTFVSWWAALS